MKKQETKPFNPEMLVIARKSRGLTQGELAKLLSMKQSHISKIEAGVLNPSQEIIDSFSSALGYQNDFFLRSDQIFGIGSSIMYHRMRQSISSKYLDKIEAQITVYRMHVARLLRSIDTRECRINFYDIEEYESPEKIAQAIRAALMLPSGPIKNLVVAIENAGCVVIPYNFGTRLLDGLSQWIPGLPPLFFINTNSPGDRLRFTLAHELGHIVMHKIPRPEMEREANKFAEELLMPMYDIAPSLQGINLGKLADLKVYWKVSMAALLHRAESLGGVSERNARYLWMQMGKAGYRLREPVDIPVEQPKTVSDMVWLHLEELGYSISDLCKLLSIEEKEFISLYGYKKRHLTLAN